MKSSSTPTPSPGLTGAELRVLDALTERVVAARRMKAAADAAEAQALAEAMALALGRRVSGVDTRTADIPVREIAAELAVAVRASDRTIQARLDDATTLVTRFSATLAALAAGEVERAHVSAIVDTGARIVDDAARAVFEEAALELCRRETPGRCRPILRMLAQRIDPVPLQERHDDAKRAADAWVRDLDDCMSQLIVLLPTHVAHGVLDRANQYARGIVAARKDVRAAMATSTEAGQSAGGGGGAAAEPDTRPLGQVRADVIADLLLTGHPTLEATDASVPEGDAIVARVQVTVPAATLTGETDDAGELAGHGPLPAGVARHLAGNRPTWTRLFTGPTGCVLAVDRYRPTSSMRRLLAARDEHCRFPGCRQPVWRCDIDHTIDAALGGRTEVRNLAHLCRRHHVLKHNTAWTVKQRSGGVLEWTSPAGKAYRDVPARMLTFASGTDEGPPGEPPGPPPPF